MTAPTPHTIVLMLERDTPGTYVYKVRHDPGYAVIETLYIKKKAFPGKPPSAITVTIEAITAQELDL